MSLVTSHHVRTAQALNRLLEATGLPAIEIKEEDVIRGALYEAMEWLNSGKPEMAKRVLKRLLEEPKDGSS